jgi:hypothetical protein
MSFRQQFDMTSPYVISLAYEYLEVLRLLQGGSLDLDAFCEAEAQRGLLHQQLTEHLGVPHDASFDMVAFARDVIWDARLKGRL